MFPTCSEILEVIRGLGYQKSSGMPVSALSGMPSGHPLPAISVDEQMSA